jgi:hypothetical protein
VWDLGLEVAEIVQAAKCSKAEQALSVKLMCQSSTDMGCHQQTGKHLVQSLSSLLMLTAVSLLTLEYHSHIDSHVTQLLSFGTSRTTTA